MLSALTSKHLVQWLRLPSAKAGGQAEVQHYLGAEVVTKLSPKEVDSLGEAKVSTSLWARSYAMVLLKGLCSGWETGWPFPFPEFLQLH